MQTSRDVASTAVGAALTVALQARRLGVALTSLARRVLQTF